MAKVSDELPVSLEGLATSIIEMDLGKYLKDDEVRALVVGAVAKELGVRPVAVRLCYSLLLVPLAELAQGALKDNAQKWALTAAARIVALLGPTMAGRLLTPLARAIRQVEITRGQKAALQAALLRDGFAGAANADTEELEREADLRERAAATRFREQVQDFEADERETGLRILGHLERQPGLLTETAPDQNGVHVYARANQPWVGRDLDIDALRTFRVDSRPFAWWAVVGDGGIGKSRLAFEFSRQLQADGWRAGILPREGEFDWSTWTVLFPTLIVIDDASTRVAEVSAIIEALARHVIPTSFPVRLLLIERHDGFLKELGRNILRRQTYIEPTQFGRPLALTPLAEDATRKLALELLGADFANLVDTVVTALDHIDPRARRPLFLRFIAEAVRRGHDPADWDQAELLRQELDDVLDRRWPKAERGVTETMLEEDRHMLAFATLTEILFFKDLAAAAALGAPLPTSTSSPQVARLARMVDAPSLSSWLPALKPDILGELFVIGVLTDLRNHSPENADKFLDAAWTLRPVPTWGSVRRCFEDWREHSDPIALLEHIPPAGSRSQWASLVRDQLEDRLAENPVEAYTLFGWLKTAYATERSLDVLVELLRAANELFIAESGNDFDSALQILSDALRLPSPDETLPSQHANLLSELGFKSNAGSPYRSLLLSAHDVCRKLGYATSPTAAVLQTIDDALTGIPAEHPARAMVEQEARGIRVLWDGKKVECGARKAIEELDRISMQLQFAQMIASVPQLSMLLAEPRSSELEATLNDTLSKLVELAAKPKPDFIEDDTWKTWRFELVQLMKSAVAAGRAAQLRPLAAAFCGVSDEMFTSFVEQQKPDNVGFRDVFLAIATMTASRPSACET